MFSRIDIDTILLMLIQDVYINTPLKFPYSFYRKEMDSETSFSYFGARYYDSDILTGWLSVDPMADKYPSLSPYAYCGWNPVKLVDPDGEEIADYYDIYGNYLGTDGIADGRIFVVTNEAEIERILDNGSDCSIQFTDANTINDKYELLPQELRKLIIDYLNESYSKQQNREYGGMAILQIDGTIEIGQYEPGPEYQEGEWGEVTRQIRESDKCIFDKCTPDPPLTRYHSHGIWLEQTPSIPTDYNNYSIYPSKYGYDMQMGMETRTVNFYNDSQRKPLFSMSFDTFKNIGL